MNGIRTDYQIHAHNAALIASITLNENQPLPEPPHRRKTVDHYWEPAEARGVPVHAPGVAGAQPGTRPDTKDYDTGKWGAYWDAIDEAAAQAKREAWWQSQRDRSAWHNARRRGADGSKVRRGRVIARDGNRCYLCGKTVEEGDLHIDHVIPVAHGGEHTEDNLAVSCSICNTTKSDYVVSIRISDRTPCYSLAVR